MEKILIRRYDNSGRCVLALWLNDDDDFLLLTKESGGEVTKVHTLNGVRLEALERRQFALDKATRVRADLRERMALRRVMHAKGSGLQMHLKAVKRRLQIKRRMPLQ